jgi:hypothetical protein
MPGTWVTTDSVDYLQRSVPLRQRMTGPLTAGAEPVRRLLRIGGIGRRDKESRGSAARATGDEPWRSPLTGPITGLYGYRIPLSFLLLGNGDSVRLHLGTWASRDTAAPGAQDRRRDVLGSVLRGTYSSIELQAVAPVNPGLPLGGIALGIPDPDGVDEADGSAPIDRIIRAMSGTSWGVLVLAYPVSEAAVSAVRTQLLNEIRTAESAVASEGATSPITEQYVEQLKISLADAADALATGAWRTAAYLLGDGDSYPRLATAWRSVFSGPRSRPEPVRVFDRSEAASLVSAWGMPDDQSDPGPGHYRRAFEYQTLLTTRQLAAYVHLPEMEAPGFAVDLAPRFDTVPPAGAGASDGVLVGQILRHKRDTGAPYRVSLKSLTRHAFVAGTTGAGKTNTIFSLLREADAAGVPFLVIEPAKTEYRAMLEQQGLGSRLRVFTPGKEAVGPFLLNPFEAPGVPVSEHLDLVRAAFAAAFGMWAPLPQILERCLHEVYLDRGWDLRTNRNERLAASGPGADPSQAYPTLSDLIAKVATVIGSLGYDDKVSGDLRAALTTRLDALRIGGKGAMLDVARSLPIADLLSAPTAVELESLGDEGDKAFVTALLLVRLAEYRRSVGQSDRLEHLLVIEEAHRLLSHAPAVTSDEQANPRGQAVETFANLLSEIRAYGQGVIIADQVPARLAPDVMKNTTLKVAHRIVSADDREALGAAMAMEPDQGRALVTLGVGEAIVFGAGDDSPLMIRVPLAKNPLSPYPPGDDVVAARMASWRAATGAASLFLPRPFCVTTCGGVVSASCETARRLAGDEYVQRTLSRLILSTLDEPTSLGRLWPDLIGAIRARKPVTVDEPSLLRSFAGHGPDWLAERRGAQAGWSYSDTELFRECVQAVLLAMLDRDATALPGTLGRLSETAGRLYRRTYDPYPACSVVCGSDPPLCLYRGAVADLVASGRHAVAWREADIADARSEAKTRTETWNVCQDAAYDLVEFPDEEIAEPARAAVDQSARRACLCFEQQMLAADQLKVPRTARLILAKVLSAGGF